MKCYHECLCGKVHRFSRKSLNERGVRLSKCAQCDKRPIHVFFIDGMWIASCEDHWNGKINGVELETLERRLTKEYEPLSFDIGSRFWCKELKCTGCGAKYEMNESW